jgi:ATP-dependent protease HslVU (ClpYQ) ATPase subunit
MQHPFESLRPEYEALLATEGVELSFADDAVDAPDSLDGESAGESAHATP